MLNYLSVSYRNPAAMMTFALSGNELSYHFSAVSQAGTYPSRLRSCASYSDSGVTAVPLLSIYFIWPGLSSNVTGVPWNPTITGGRIFHQLELVSHQMNFCSSVKPVVL